MAKPYFPPTRRRTTWWEDHWQYFAFVVIVIATFLAGIAFDHFVLKPNCNNGCEKTVAVDALPTPAIVLQARPVAPIATATIAPSASPTATATRTATLAPSSTPITIATATATNRPTLTPKPTATGSPFIEAPSGLRHWVVISILIPRPESGGIAIVGKWRLTDETDYTKPAKGQGLDHTWYFQVSLGTEKERKDKIASLVEYLNDFIGKEITIDYDSSDERSPNVLVNFFQKNYWDNHEANNRVNVK